MQQYTVSEEGYHTLKWLFFKVCAQNALYISHIYTMITFKTCFIG